MKMTISMGVKPVAMVRPHILEYVELFKIRIAVMVLFTVAVGFYLGCQENARGLSNSKTSKQFQLKHDLGLAGNVLTLFHVLLGTALVAIGANTLNQYLERDSDALMQRTANRPLPAGRISANEALFFGMLTSVMGIAYLALMITSPLSAMIAGLTLLSYVFLYTPMKRITRFNTIVGAVPGALPPLIGWCAVRPNLDGQIICLFAFLFFWQLPHFASIAWMYRQDYQRGGLKMVSTEDRSGRITAWTMIVTCILLLAVSLMPSILGYASLIYLIVAFAGGLIFLNSTLRFNENRTHPQARKVLKTSVIYLAAILAFWLIDVQAIRPLFSL